MHRFIAILLFFILSTSGCAKEPARLDIAGLSEASTNFDQEHVSPFLARVTKLFGSGFGVRQATDLSKEIDSLPVGSTGMWEYSVSFNGKAARLVVSAFKDDADSPDIYFYSSPSVTQAVQSEMNSFTTELGE